MREDDLIYGQLIIALGIALVINVAVICAGQAVNWAALAAITIDVGAGGAIIWVLATT